MHVPCTCHAHTTQSCGALRPPASARPRRAWRAWPRLLSRPCRARARAPVAGSAAAHVACRPARRTRRGLESPPEAAAGGWGRTAASRPARARTGLHPRRLLVHVRMCACGAYRGCVRPRCSACSSLVTCRWGGATILHRPKRVRPQPTLSPARALSAGQSRGASPRRAAGSGVARPAAPPGQG